MTVWDVGAHVGYHTLLMSKIVGPQGKVLSVEPSPRNIAFLRQHITLNRCTNVELMEAVIQDRDGKVAFASDGYRGYTGHVGSGAGDLMLPCLALDSLPGMPDVIKMDIEGAEALVLGASTRVLTTKPTLVVGVHGLAVGLSCRNILTQHKYEIQEPGVGDIFATSV